MSKLQLTDSTMEILDKMSEGNPGALSILTTLLFKETAEELVDSVMHIILPLDTLGVYGSKLYMLWTDACDKNTDKVKKVIELWRIGKITKEEIHENLNQGYAKPFDQVEEFFKKKDDDLERIEE